MTTSPTTNGISSPARSQMRRLVLNFPGFEKTDSERQIGRLLHGAAQSGKVWGYSVERGETIPQPGTHSTRSALTAEGENWQSATDLVQFRWNDIVDEYEKAPFPGGFLRDCVKYSRFFTDGTVRRYFSASARYWGFTIFPLLLAILFAAIAGSAIWFALGALAVPPFAKWLILVPLTLIAVLILCRWPGEHLYIPMTIADWGFARDMVNRSNPVIEERFAEFARTTGEAISASTHDEIVVVGHSFGAVWAAAALSMALEENPDLLDGKKLTFEALGSSIAKIALAPGAQFMRDHVARIAACTNVFWHEVQTKDDFIAFYRADPFAILGISPSIEYRIDRIRFSRGMERKRYRKMRKSMYRTHRQYILHYDKRVAFDHMLRLFGPLPAAEISRNAGLQEQLATGAELATLMAPA